MLRRMRWWFWFAAALLAGLAGSSWVAAQDAEAAYYGSPRVSVSVSYFYDALAPYGRWVSYSPYGWCWTPSDVSFGWRPYSDGAWDYTDYGWTWVDNEPWGWAPYHYGRWLYDDDYGWLWVPGTDWAPAWVAWSADDDWVGWTPLPPGVDWNASFGVSFASFDVRRVPSSNWCFVARRDLATSDLRSRIVPIGRNVSIVSHTQNVTQFAVRGGRPVNMGPNVGSVERAWGHNVPRMRIVDAATPRNVHVRPAGGQLELFRGRIAPAPAHAAPPSAARRPLQSGVQNRVMTAPGVNRQHADVRRTFDGDVQRERGRLMDQQRREISTAPSVQARQTMMQRHVVEQRAFAQQAVRERAQFDRRMAPAPPQAQRSQPQRPQPQPQRPQAQRPQP